MPEPGLATWSRYAGGSARSPSAAAKDPCSDITPSGHALQIIADIRTSLLASGTTSVLFWICAVFASRNTSGSTSEARRALLALSILVLVGFACSYGWYALSSTCMEFA
jgi:hypothetical protein